MSAATMIIELITGLARNFPITLFGTTLVGGLALGHMAWLFMGLGALSTVLLCIFIQFIAGEKLGTGIGSYFPKTADAAVIQACSLVPIATGSTYFYIPSLWMALTTYFLFYIFLNAQTVYTTPPTKLPQEALPVQHRKSVGVVSMVTTVLLFVALLSFRLRTGCELTSSFLGLNIPFGALLGIVLGGILAYTTHLSASAGRGTLYTDVHGVMAGLQPGSLRDHPLACAPKKA
jgi:hypothetical protein